MAADVEIRQFMVGHLQTNCYALVSEGECLVIDPGASGAQIAQELMDTEICGIVATHGHHDHVCGVAALKRACGAPFAISWADAERAQKALELSSHSFDVSQTDLEDAPAPDRLLRDGDVVKVGSVELKVLETPGHTEGGIVLLGDGVAFMGDTLFAGSCGRTDLVGGDHSTLMLSLERLKREIPPETTLLCGHGIHTTMAHELATNPWLQ
ncbi:MAG: MBL fold metallo-hydrolase [Coriobacteriales bacterium]|nr:MBL fold metallo-hydrolase [Coriobacteriales bacterium]